MQPVPPGKVGTQLLGGLFTNQGQQAVTSHLGPSGIAGSGLLAGAPISIHTPEGFRLWQRVLALVLVAQWFISFSG